MIEHEAKILDIDPQEIENKLLDAGAKFIAERNMCRYVYDVEVGDASRWLRLRDDGSEVTLTYKHVHHGGIDGVDEVEVQVGDFEATNALLAVLGYTPKGYQENRRISYTLDGAQVELDFWPLLPAPYLEIEGESREHVIRVAGLLGYGEEQLSTEGTVEIYARHGIVLASISDLRF